MSATVAKSSPSAMSFDGTRLLRLPAVIERVGLQRSAVYELVKAGRFPRPLKAGAASVWLDHEVSVWIGELSAARDA